VAVRDITPAQAQELLKLNTNNRQLKTRHAEVLADDMRAGRFRFNGDPIRFNGSTLLDGQHRLYACVLSGIPFRAVVVFDLDDTDCMATLDGGRKRTLADRLHLRGEKYAGRLSSILTSHYLLTAKNYSNRATQLSSGALIQWLDQHPGLREAAEWWVANEKAMRAIGAGYSVVAAMWHEATLLSVQSRDEFFELLASGVGLSDDSPVLLLRNRLIANASARTKMTARDIVAICIKAWNLYRVGAGCKVLRWTRDGRGSEDWPVME